jgi:D-alanine-D-alanine ligase
MRDTRPAVALIFGGMGYEREISISGAPYLHSLIDKSKFKVIPLLIEKSGIMTEAEISGSGASSTGVAAHLFRMFGRGGVIAEGDFTPLAAAIPLLHGDLGEDGTIQGALTTVGVPYVGCEPCAGSLCLDKIFTKIIAEHLSIPVAKYRTYIKNCDTLPDLDEFEEHLQYPMFVKPARLGSSVGISIAKDRASLEASIAEAWKLGSGRVLIEECVNVRKEAEVAFLELSGKRIFTEAGSVSGTDGFYDYDKKYLKPTAQISDNANLSAEQARKIKEYSEALASFIGLRHISRIDFFISEEGKVIFNEINTFPGFTSGSLYPRLLKKAGIDPAFAINSLISEVAGV